MRGPFTSYDTWELEERAMVERFVLPGMRALELGTGTGTVTRALVGRRCAEVWSVDPWLHLHAAQLGDVLALQHVRVWPCAADVEDGVAAFVPNSEWWAGGMDAHHRYGQALAPVRVPTVDAWRLAKALSADVVLMDIEGTERRILAPMQASRIPSSVRYIIVERHGDLPELLPGWHLAAVDDLVETWAR